MSAEPYSLRAVPACPECGGPWLNSWRWQHSPTDCDIRLADDSTQAADMYRIKLGRETYRRYATEAERRMFAHVSGRELPTGAATVVHADFVKGIWPRAIFGVPSAADVSNQTA